MGGCVTASTNCSRDRRCSSFHSIFALEGTVRLVVPSFITLTTCSWSRSKSVNGLAISAKDWMCLLWYDKSPKICRTSPTVVTFLPIRFLTASVEVSSIV